MKLFAGALVRMAIDLGVDLQIVRQIVVAGQIIEVVVAQDLTIGEGHVRVLLRRGRRNAFGRRRRIGHAAIGDAQIRLPVGRIAGPVPTQPVQHVLGQIGVVRLVGARQVGEGGDGAAIEAVHGLAVELTAPGRLVVALVHEQVLLAVLTGHIGREAVVLARVHTQGSCAWTPRCRSPGWRPGRTNGWDCARCRSGRRPDCWWTGWPGRRCRWPGPPGPGSRKSARG